MKILEKTARFEVSSSQTMQNTETATDRCATEITTGKKMSSESQFFWKCNQNQRKEN